MFQPLVETRIRYLNECIEYEELVTKGTLPLDGSPRVSSYTE